MFLRRFTDFILQSRVQAMAAAFVIAFIPVIGSISILIAAFVTLRKGVIEGALVAIAATLPYVISYYVSETEQEQISLAIIWILVFSNFLTWLFAIVLRHFNNWSFTIELAALLGVLVIGIIHLLYPNVQDWWAGQLTSYFAKTVNVVDKINENVKPLTVSNEAQAQAILIMKQYATGFVTVCVLLNALLQLLIARWWQAAMFNPGELRKELQQIRLGHVAGGIFVVGLILTYYGSDFVLDAIPILYTAFFVAGLSLIHYLIGKTQMGWVWLIVIYAGLIWLFPLSVIAIAFIALLDTTLDFRKRFQI